MRKSQSISVLAIAGSDSGGGAGIAVDLACFAAFGLHGLAAITAVTAQTTREVTAIHRVPAGAIAAQIRAAFADFRVGAIKIGMLGSAAAARAVADELRRAKPRHVVLDPVVAASDGSPLLPRNGIAILRDELIPQATLLTPNLPEAEILLGKPIDDPVRAARELRALGAHAVLLKGGHGHGNVVRDILVDARDVVEYRHPRLPIRARGTGCALSAAVAAGLARGRNLRRAVDDAEGFLQRALADSYRVGAGPLRRLRLDSVRQ